ncbi:hypothetical protein T265_14703, partial [Opisthorchis viverrini]
MSSQTFIQLAIERPTGPGNDKKCMLWGLRDVYCSHSYHFRLKGRSLDLAQLFRPHKLNTFARSDVRIQRIQMRPMCVGGMEITRSSGMPGVRSTNPGKTIGYALLASSNKSESRVHFFPRPFDLLGHRSMSRAHQSHRSSVNTFRLFRHDNSDASNVCWCSSGYTLASHVRCPGFKSRHAIGYTLLMSSNKSETRVQCFPLVWTGQNTNASTGTRPFKREWCGYEQM